MAMVANLVVLTGIRRDWALYHWPRSYLARVAESQTALAQLQVLALQRPIRRRRALAGGHRHLSAHERVAVPPAHRLAASRATLTAATAAPTPLSMLTTAMPGAHADSSAPRATRPSTDTP